MSANELRKAAETLRSKETLKADLGSREFIEALAFWLARTADIQTAIEVLQDADVEMLVLDNGQEATHVALLINGGAR